MQAVVHAPAPAGEVWNSTVSMPRSDVATALSITVPRSGVPGSVSVTATVLNVAALLKIEPGLLVPATKAASDLPKLTGSRTASSSRAVTAQVSRLVRNARAGMGGHAHARVTSAIGGVRATREGLDTCWTG